jgi:hypothetical protein
VPIRYSSREALPSRFVFYPWLALAAIRHSCSPAHTIIELRAAKHLPSACLARPVPCWNVSFSARAHESYAVRQKSVSNPSEEATKGYDLRSCPLVAWLKKSFKGLNLSQPSTNPLSNNRCNLRNLRIKSGWLVWEIRFRSARSVMLIDSNPFLISA